MGRFPPQGLVSEELASALQAAFAVGKRLEGFDGDLRGFVVGSLDLAGGFVSGLDLDAADARGTDLSRSEVVRSSFVTAKLDGADLRGARLHNCVLRNARLTGATLDGALFDACDLRDADLSGASLRKVRFVSCAMQNVDLHDADLSRAAFDACSLHAANLNGALLDRCLMPGCVTRGVTLVGARRFYLTRMLVGQALLDASEGDLEREKYAHLVRERKDLCWDAWKDIAAAADPALRAWAVETLSGYAAGGLIDAFVEGIPASGADDD